MRLLLNNDMSAILGTQWKLKVGVRKFCALPLFAIYVLSQGCVGAFDHIVLLLCGKWGISTQFLCSRMGIQPTENLKRLIPVLRIN